MHLREKLESSEPKKLLALDGGGIRGLITLEVLAKIETTVGKALGDYFDYIAGTSTGAIIGACLSLGMTVAEVAEFYESAGAEMFDRARLLRRFRYKFEDGKLARMLEETFERRNGGVTPTLGSSALKTLLTLVLRNATTDSPWPLSNNPRAKYNVRSSPDEPSNLDLPLWQLVRASTAAPTYFPPERISVGSYDFLFVDGGVTMYNNPAFLLLLMATLPEYKLEWPTGPDKLLLVSVGTGASEEANNNLLPGQMNLLYHAESVPSALMFAALVEQDKLCRVFGRCLHGAVLESELGDLGWRPEAPSGLPKLCTYVRYNADISKKGLAELGLPDIDPAHVAALDSVNHIRELKQVGSALARQVDRRHFAGFGL